MAEFRYTTIARMRENFNILAGSVPDAKMAQFIRSASEAINRFTSQYFQPVTRQIAVSGTDDPVVTAPELVPFITVSSVMIDYDRARADIMWRRGAPVLSAQMFFPNLFNLGTIGPFGTVLIEPQYWDFDQSGRVLHLTIGRFPDGFRNVIVDCVTGWLKEQGRGILFPSPANPTAAMWKATTTAQIATGDSTITVDDATGLSVGDIVEIDLKARDTVPAATGTPKIEQREALKLQRIVTGINANVLSVDPIESLRFGTIPTSQSILSYGSVPDGIVEVCEAFVNKAAQRYISAQTGGGGGVDASQVGRIKREKTDNYEYELFGLVQTFGNLGGLGALTNDVYLDMILRSYSAPPYVGYA